MSLLSLFPPDSGDGVSLKEWGRACLWLLSVKHGQPRPVLWPLLWSVKRGELTLELLAMGFTQCWTEGFSVPCTTLDGVSGIVTSHGPHTLCSQSYTGPQLLQPPLTQQAAPPSRHTRTLLPTPWSSSISICVALCLRQVPLRAVMFLSAPLLIDISTVSSTSLTVSDLCPPFSPLWQNAKCFLSSNHYQRHTGTFSLGSSFASTACRSWESSQWEHGAAGPVCLLSGSRGRWIGVLRHTFSFSFSPRPSL